MSHVFLSLIVGPILSKFFCLPSIHLIRLPSSFTLCNTSTFVTLSIQFIFTIRLHTHTSNALSLSVSYFRYVHLSLAYETVLHIKLLTMLFLNLTINFMNVQQLLSYKSITHPLSPPITGGQSQFKIYAVLQVWN